MISYAQNFEDVMLWRALGHVENGFYIDVGAQHPIEDSVSRAFYENGWRGIHVEPTQFYANLLRENRPDETVLQTAISTESGVMKFFEIPGTGISTGDPAIAKQHQERGFPVHETTVSCITLASVFKSCAGKEIHWLKIDVEGMEQRVLEGWGQSRLRPWVVVVESTLPLTQTASHVEWEPLLLNRGYRFAYFDGLNNFYVSEIHKELLGAFLSGPNVFDNFALSGTANSPFSSRLLSKIESLEQQTTALKEEAAITLSAQESEFRSQLILIGAAAEAREKEMKAAAERDALNLAETLAAHKLEHGLEIAAKESLHNLEIAARENSHRLEIAAGENSHKIEIAARENLHKLDIAAQENSHRLEAAAKEKMHSLEIAAARHDLAVLRNTLSWRLTRPFRAIGQRFEGNRKSTRVRGAKDSLPMDSAPVSEPIPMQASEQTNNSSASQKANMSPVSSAGPKSPQISHAQSVAELLAFDGDQFVECVYLTLLKRSADASGGAFYLNRLCEGISKIQILDEISSSEEAKRSGVVLAGLQEEIARSKLVSLRSQGLLARLFGGAEGISAVETRLRAMEQKNFRIGREAEKHFEQVDHGLNKLQKLIVQHDQQLLESVRKSLAAGGQSYSVAHANVLYKVPGNKRPVDTTVNAADRPRQGGPLYFFVDHTVKCPINTGMQRVVRRLGRSLVESGNAVRFVKWDSALAALVLINREELEHLSKWYGPSLIGEALHIYPLVDGAPVVVVPQKSDGTPWLVVPEVTHVTYQPVPITLELIATANRLGLKTAFVYYDAIPLRLAEYKDAAAKHEMYMQHLLLADLVMPISFRSAVELGEFFGIHQASTISIPRIHALPLPGESQLSARIHEPGQFAIDDPFILSVGSIEPRKNQIALVRAFENFCQANPDTYWRLVLAGNLRGDVAAEINGAIERNSRISYVPNPSDRDLDSLYRSCAFTVFPSVEEGFGLPILESLWYAKPCICADFGAMDEVAAGGGCYQVDTRKLVELESAITHLVGNSEIRYRLGKEASQRVISRWDDYGKSVVELLDEESDALRDLEYVFYWVDDTCVNLQNSGIQRVVRQLARALITMGIKLVPVKWDVEAKLFYSPSANELEHLSAWNGPQPAGWTAWIDPRQTGKNSWILIPELTHETLGDVREYALEAGIRCSAIFYDAIPWKMQDMFPASFAENHRKYMEALSKFEKILPISKFSRAELINFFLSTAIRTHSLEQRVQTCSLANEFIDVPRVTQARRNSSDTIRILSVISIEPRKNPLALLEAFAIASAKSKARIELTLVGRSIASFSDLATKVESKIALLKNANWEHDVDDGRLQALYAQSDFTIFPSIEEGFGLPILESLWYALPCICHNEGAMAEVAEGGGCVSIDITNVDALTDAISRLANDQALRLSLANAASHRPIKSWLDYAREVGISLSTERRMFTKGTEYGVSDEARLYRELANVKPRPLLSICISTYNRAEWLAVGLRNLERMLPTPLADAEIFVCDNTSTDHTPDVVQPYLARSDFRYLRNEKNVGMLGNLRVTAHNARGRYIWILGDDDLPMPGSIENILSIIRAQPELALVYLNYSFTRETDARAVTDLDAFFARATTLAATSEDMNAPVKNIAANNENLFTAIYCLVFRRDHALRAYSQNTDGRPFSTMRTSIPTTYYVLNFMMDEPAYWVGAPQLVVNFNVSWNNYAALQILERVPEAQDLAERMGGSATGLDRWRENLFSGFVHYFREMFENDAHGNSTYFSPVMLVARMKHLEAFRALVPALRVIYESARERGHPCAEMPAEQLFAAFEKDGRARIVASAR